MITVGIRELKQQASELIRQVRETGSEVQITYHGKVVARLVPVVSRDPEVVEKAWAALDELALEISAAWPNGVTATQALGEDRR